MLKDFQGIAEKAKDLPKHEPSHRVWTGDSGRRCAKPGASTSSRAGARSRAGSKRSSSGPGQIRLGGGRAPRRGRRVAVIGLSPWKRAPGLSDQDRFTLAKLEEAEKHYKLAIRALNEAIGSQKNGLDPQVAAVFDRNLKEIDTAIQACQNAVVKEPRTPRRPDVSL